MRVILKLAKPHMDINSQAGHIVILLALLVVLSACKYFKIEPDQMVLGAILVALNVGSRPPNVTTTTTTDPPSKTVKSETEVTSK